MESPRYLGIAFGMFYKLPPAGAPITLRDFLHSIRQALSGATVERFKNELCNYFGVRHCFLVSSGKAGLTIALRCLADSSDKQEVLMPAYTCFSVPSAVARAGFWMRFCDVSKASLDLDLDKLENTVSRNTLCVIVTHLFGLACQMDKIQQITWTRGVSLIDDAAQAAGATLNGQMLGTLGDIGLLSFGRGKNISMTGGGAILTSCDRHAKRIQKLLSVAGTSAFESEIRTLGKIIAYYIFLHPRMYWLPDALPFFDIGKTIFSTAFPIGSFSRLQAGMGISLLRRLEDINKVRRRNAKYIIDFVNSIQSISIPDTAIGSKPVYVRLPLIARDHLLQEKIFATLTSHGIGASKMYPTALDEIPDIGKYVIGQISPCINARYLARKLLSLPTHPLVKQGDLDRMIELLQDICY